MPLLPEFASYASEDDFVQRFLIPLLARIGFGVVVNYHGKQEAGMDLVVGDIDRFGHVRYYGIQAKFEPSIGKMAAHGLVQDATEAFVAGFTHPQTGTHQAISSFYALNAGSISDEARSHFFAALQPAYGDNVRLLEGRDLLALDRSATSRVDEVRSRLTALRLEAEHALRQLDILEPVLEEIVRGDGHGARYPMERLRLLAAAGWLAAPPPIAAVPSESIEELYALGSIFNRSLDEASGSPLQTVVSVKVPAKKALAVAGRLRAVAAATRTAIGEHLQELGAIVPL